MKIPELYIAEQAFLNIKYSKEWIFGVTYQKLKKLELDRLFIFEGVEYYLYAEVWLFVEYEGIIDFVMHGFVVQNKVTGEKAGLEYNYDIMLSILEEKLKKEYL
jgi:hypothetical protein